MLGHFLRRDLRDFLLWWGTLGVITCGFLLAHVVLPTRFGLWVLVWAYVMFPVIAANLVLGSVWRTQHQWSRYYLLSLPLAHETLFAIQHGNTSASPAMSRRASVCGRGSPGCS